MTPQRAPWWRAMDLDERQREYSPSSMVANADISPYLDAYADRSADARATVTPTVLAYGPRDTNTVDVFAPPLSVDGSGLHAFIHGGYWQQLTKSESAFPALETLDRGLGFAAVDYTLAPAVPLTEIVAECTAALSRLHTLTGDLVVSGSSAGAHLCAMATLQALRSAMPVPDGLILVSGVYELEPLVGTTINEAVAMTVTEARTNSPLLASDHDLAAFPPTVVAWGEHETDEFKRQSRALVDRLDRVGVAVAEVEVPGRNHFDVVFDIVEVLFDALDELVARPQPQSPDNR